MSYSVVQADPVLLLSIICSLSFSHYRVTASNEFLGSHYVALAGLELRNLPASATMQGFCGRGGLWDSISLCRHRLIL